MRRYAYLFGGPSDGTVHQIDPRVDTVLVPFPVAVPARGEVPEPRCAVQRCAEYRATWDRWYTEPFGDMVGCVYVGVREL